MLSRTHLINSKDPDYFKYLYNKRIAIVGPSSNTLNTNQGDFIDKFDIIVRLNKSLPIPDNMKKDIGSKTDILYNSFNLSDYPGENELKIQKLKKNIKYISSPYPFIYPFTNDILTFITKNEGEIPFHLIDIILYKTICHMLTCRPYTGTSAIIDLLQFPIKELYITGIDCYLCKYYNEYRKITKSGLFQLQNNHIHQNKPQLDLIKKLALNDNRIRLDSFLSNYFFNKEYIIYNKIKRVENIFENYNTDKSFNSILNKKNPIIYSNQLNNKNFFIIGDSFNYNNLHGVADIYFNFNNNNNKPSVSINNDITSLIDFNIKKNILESIKKNTDIKNIYIISFNIIQKFLSLSYFKNINYRFIIINIIILNISDVLYIDNKLLNDFSNEENNYIKFLQTNNKIKIINIK